MSSLQSWKSFLFVPLLGGVWMCCTEWGCSIQESHHQLFSIRWDVLVADSTSGKINRKSNYLPSPTLWCHHYAERGRNTEKSPQTSQLAGACLLLHPPLSNCIFTPTVTQILLVRRVAGVWSHLIPACEYIKLIRRPRRSNLCWDYSPSGAKMDWAKCLGVMSHILTLQGASRFGWTLKIILLLRMCSSISIPASVILHREGWHPQNLKLSTL